MYVGPINIRAIPDDCITFTADCLKETTGASMNPVRTLGPAIAANNYKAYGSTSLLQSSGRWLGQMATHMTGHQRHTASEDDHRLKTLVRSPIRRHGNDIYSTQVNKDKDKTAGMENEHSEKNAEEISNSVFGGGSGRLEEAKLVGDLFGGAGGEGDDGSEPDGPAAEEGIAS
ncbi:hypothetical protein HYC85_004418 [Camellia sinensis]|uniref:Uncharacterized protein n=1 Tax=Camellia sinensis TaxID=4442 RepID=A0A7J7HWI2_CAMSI|nr:hypothetical protein HYC85_004418 [Camellia sinensis]